MHMTGVTVTDTFPSEVASVSWTCVAAGGASCTASGTGDISDSVILPAGSSVTYTILANTDPAATAHLVNTATVAVPAGVNDPDSSNNSATDADTRASQADLAITKDAQLQARWPTFLLNLKTSYHLRHHENITMFVDHLLANDAEAHFRNTCHPAIVVLAALPDLSCKMALLAESEAPIFVCSHTLACFVRKIARVGSEHPLANVALQGNG